ncbi:unnamed protein product [Phytophthora fragariaefolia]|uniref:Unnamed protein product n=1 Tax=Phytophthora fragariaefolia TaxID=1490495 RepID=A0A9W7D153_9STRA|nr:unnamed protein product [Phytophthora fragariaefolia]
MMDPAKAGVELWKWKKRLTKFSSWRQKSSSSAGTVTDPALVPLPQTPKMIEQGNRKPTATGGVFNTTAGRTPYFQDSYMVTPRSAMRQERVDRAADNSIATENTRRGTEKSMRRRYQAGDDSSSENQGYDGDGGVQMNEYMRQTRSLTDSEQSNATPRIEVATHRPLGKIKPFSERRNTSENTIQWLRYFIYEMKGTRAPANEWCMPFELNHREALATTRANTLEDAITRADATPNATTTRGTTITRRTDEAETMIDAATTHETRQEFPWQKPQLPTCWLSYTVETVAQLRTSLQVRVEATTVIEVVTLAVNGAPTIRGARSKNGVTSCHQTGADDISLQPMKASAESPLRVPMLVPITGNTGVTDSTATSTGILVPMTDNWVETTVHGNIGLERRVGAPTTPYICASGSANCVNKCTMLASAKASKKSLTSSAPRWRRRT